ncbi:hypothetical protein HPB51_026411 [Rhipicephalus microplus]|uniref:Uncharacterized protein n=1 Tax=Rhipicephalus microplus TaxID=6941 RepID=A0A9J6D353_RHIMP|nr:hypothetical protein HPB51_026411 [Rhipicephalus microplus]
MARPQSPSLPKVHAAMTPANARSLSGFGADLDRRPTVFVPELLPELLLIVWPAARSVLHASLQALALRIVFLPEQPNGLSLPRGQASVQAGGGSSHAHREGRPFSA